MDAVILVVVLEGQESRGGGGAEEYGAVGEELVGDGSVRVVLIGDNHVMGDLEVALRRRRWRQADLRDDIVPTAGWSDSVTDVGEKGRKRLRGGAGPVGA